MSGLSAKTRDRVLYLISPIGLLLFWQLLLMAGIGDRRFVPAPSDITVQFWTLIRNGELAVHTGVTLLRVFTGFVAGAGAARALGLRVAGVRPVRVFFVSRCAALFSVSDSSRRC